MKQRFRARISVERFLASSNSLNYTEDRLNNSGYPVHFVKSVLRISRFLRESSTMFEGIPEADWEIFRQLHQLTVERFACQ
jgi:hypothetical protein